MATLPCVFGINNSGQAVGRSERVPGERIFHAFFWDGEDLIDLGAIGGFYSSRADDINNADQVVGRPFFLYDPVEGMIDLENRMPFESGRAGLNPKAISDAGQIGDWGYHAGPASGFPMTPVPPPIPAVASVGAAVLFVAIGSVFVIRRRRARWSVP